MTRYPLDDAKRLESLERSGLMDKRPEEVFDRLTRLASRILEAPVALVSFLDDKRQVFKSLIGLGEPWATTRETPLTHSYCHHVVASGTPLVVADAREHPNLRDSPAIKNFNGIAYCGVPVVAPEGSVVGTLCVMDDHARQWDPDEVAALQDLARSVVAEVHLRLLAADLEDSNAALLEFVAVASHDIRSPLGLIQMYAHLIAGDSGDIPESERREYADLIVGEVQRANHLVRDLLQVTKLEADGIEPVRASFDLASALEAAVRDHAQPDRVDLSVPAGLEAFADRDHVHRIVSNLVGNALKHGRPPVSIEARRLDGNVEIVIADQGSGVPPEFVPRLYQKFARSDEARTSGKEGSGLGLAIVAGLAKLNGGSVRYEPNRPTGSRFILDLPISAN